MKLPIEALELIRFTSDDETRPNLHWLKVEGTTAVATNGYMLAKYVWEGDSMVEAVSIEDPLFVDAGSLAHAMKQSTKKNRSHGAKVDPVEMLVELHMLQPQRVTMERQVNFPDEGQVIPKRDDKATGEVLGINMKFLADIHAWFKAVGWETEARVQTGGPYEPIRIDAEKPEHGCATFVVMPCQL